ncbi:MAG: response regulator transcription factor [Micrococcales bacterium]|nr:response regulator transcription factor [Micrococcales bacterium]MCL2666656.1 response regulator transcription factor [Micrococcales bacterium]
MIIVTRSSVVDAVAGLNGGADNYMAKPLGFDELLARIRPRLRKTKTRRVSTDGRDVDLSARKSALLETLRLNAYQVLSREWLLVRVWGHHYDHDSKVVDVHICCLRRQLGPDVIETIRGMGFCLHPG